MLRRNETIDQESTVAFRDSSAVFVIALELFDITQPRRRVIVKSHNLLS